MITLNRRPDVDCANCQEKAKVNKAPQIKYHKVSCPSCGFMFKGYDNGHVEWYKNNDIRLTGTIHAVRAVALRRWKESLGISSSINEGTSGTYGRFYRTNSQW